MDVNPYAPPRATDDAGGPGPPGGGPILTAEAMSVLGSTRPWARWSARLAIGALLVGLVNTLLRMRTGAGATVVGSVVELAISIPISVAIIVVINNYVRQLDAFFAGDRHALGAAFGAQKGFIKLTGVLLFVAVGALLVLGGFALLLNYAARQRGIND